MSIRCIQCGRADLEPKVVQLAGEVRNEAYTVELAGFECHDCHYKTIEGASMPEYGRLLSDKYRAAHGLLTSDEIRARRSQLEMTQEKFAQYLGVGLASVKRWEMGKIQDQRNNELILQKTASPANSVHAYLIPFGIIHASSTQQWWPRSAATATCALTLGRGASLGIERYIDDVMSQEGVYWGGCVKQTRILPGLRLSSPRTISPHLAALFITSREDHNN